MAVIGKPRSFNKKFLFLVEFDGVVLAKFQSAGPLKMEVGVVEQWEGGTIIPSTSPGRVKAMSTTLKRGQTSNLDLWRWMKQVANIAANSGAIDALYKRTGAIVQLDRDGSRLTSWSVHDAYPTSFTAGDWDATADANVIEEVVLQYTYFDPSTDTGAAATA